MKTPHEKRMEAMLAAPTAQEATEAILRVFQILRLYETGMVYVSQASEEVGARIMAFDSRERKEA